MDYGMSTRLEAGNASSSMQPRCTWAQSAPDYLAYHDEEWGRPVSEDRQVFERLCLEGFQSGLSWITILRKRAAFRRAFCDFDPSAVASLEEAEIATLVSDSSIIRHRGKILATICNARATLRLQSSGRTLAGLCWSYEPPPAPAPTMGSQIPASTSGSAALARELKALGFIFVGPVTAYSLMQSLGVVDDHLADCSIRPLVEVQRGKFVRPKSPQLVARPES